MAGESRQHDLRHLDFVGAPTSRRGSFAALQQRGAAAPPHQPRPSSHPFINWLLRRAGLDPAAYRCQPLQRRLPACLRALQVHSTAEARRNIEAHPELLQPALDAFLLGVTQFFRDPGVFEELNGYLPALAARRRPLRIWSAACSNGAELYSVAILLSELGLLEGARLKGTDCRAAAIASAAAGRFGHASLQHLPPALQSRYFRRAGDYDLICPELRRAARFRVQDLLQPGNWAHWDVVLWRNTAIYMTSVAAQQVWARLVASLHPGGLLVTGKAERLDGMHPLKRVTSCIYIKN